MPKKIRPGVDVDSIAPSLEYGRQNVSGLKGHSPIKKPTLNQSEETLKPIKN